MKTLETKSIKVIFFDVDDTLFNKVKAHKMALQHIMKKYDIFKDIDESELLDAFDEADRKSVKDFDKGVPMEEIRRKRSKRIIDHFGLEEDFTDTFHNEFLNTYPRIDAEIEGAVETVRTLNQSYKLGIITNSTKETQIKKLNTLNIKKYFQEFVFSEEVGSRKPDDQIFLTAVNRVDEEPENCLYVGDSFNRDIIGANRIGMRTCWFNNDKSCKTKIEGANIEINKLKQLLEIF